MMYTFKAVETKADNTTNNLGRENQKETTWGWGSLLESAMDLVRGVDFLRYMWSILLTQPSATCNRTIMLLEIFHRLFRGTTASPAA